MDGGFDFYEARGVLCIKKTKLEILLNWTGLRDYFKEE
jgi:hypothetical protein